MTARTAMNKTSLGGALLAIGVLCSSGGAKAAPRTHDGFQFRGTIGGGYLSDSETIDSGISVAGITLNGGAGAFELYVGGAPADGLVIGGFESGMVAVGPKVKVNGVTDSADYRLSLGMVGPYVDYYPDPTTGFHLTGILAYAEVRAHGRYDNTPPSSGFALGAGVGYDWWVGDAWSLGILGRLSYAATSHTEPPGFKVTDDAVAPVIMFSACFQ